LLFILVVGTYATAKAIGIEEPLTAWLPLMWVVLFLTCRVAFRLSRRRATFLSRVEFHYPVYVLQDPGGLVLCTEEPDGGYLAVFTGPDTAERYREIRSVHEWAPTPFSQTQLCDLLRSAKHTGRVGFVMIDPLVGDQRVTLVFPLSFYMGCLGT
jgi:hypothetical protein